MTTEIVKVDKNGRIYLPASLRKKLGVDSFYVEERGDEIVLIPVRKRIRKYYGIFKGENLSAEEIDQLIEEETEQLLRDKL